MSATTVTVTAKGMTCEHCVHAVTEEVSKLAGVKYVDVDLDTGRVSVTSESPLDEGAVVQAIDEAGYEVVASGPDLVGSTAD